MVRKTVHRTENNDLLLYPQCSKRGYKHRIKERKMELRHMQEMQELRSSLEKLGIFHFFAGCPIEWVEPSVHL